MVEHQFCQYHRIRYYFLTIIFCGEWIKRLHFWIKKMKKSNILKLCFDPHALTKYGKLVLYGVGRSYLYEKVIKSSSIWGSLSVLEYFPINIIPPFLKVQKSYVHLYPGEKYFWIYISSHCLLFWTFSKLFVRFGAP